MAAKIRSIRGPKKSALKSVAELAKIPESGLSRKRSGKPRRTLRTAINELRYETMAARQEHLALKEIELSDLCDSICQRLAAALELPDA